MRWLQGPGRRQGPGLPDRITQHALGLRSVQAFLCPWATRPGLNQSPLLPRARTLCLGAANTPGCSYLVGQDKKLCLWVRPGCSSRGKGQGQLATSAPSVVPACGVLRTVYSADSYIQTVIFRQLSTGNAPLCISGFRRGLWVVGWHERMWQRERGQGSRVRTKAGSRGYTRGARERRRARHARRKEEGAGADTGSKKKSLPCLSWGT